MSIVHFEGDECFFCPNPITGTGVEWISMNGEAIILHPKCAVQLGSRLIGDGVKIDPDLSDRALSWTQDRIGAGIRKIAY
jgi:hypothetical protein